MVCALIFAAAPRAFATDRPEREFKECADCPQMVGIPAGAFLMGSPAHEPGRFDAEGPQRRVAIRPDETIVGFIRIETVRQPRVVRLQHARPRALPQHDPTQRHA